MGEEGFLLEEGGEALARTISERLADQGSLDFSDRSKLIQYIEETGAALDSLEAEEINRAAEEIRVKKQGEVRKAEIKVLAQFVADSLKVAFSEDFGDKQKAMDIAEYLHDTGITSVEEARPLLLQLRARMRQKLSPIDGLWEVVQKERHGQVRI